VCSHFALNILFPALLSRAIIHLKSDSRGKCLGKSWVSGHVQTASYKSFTCEGMCSNFYVNILFPALLSRAIIQLESDSGGKCLGKSWVSGHVPNLSPTSPLHVKGCVVIFT
jgi:hypothetical protein